MPGIDRKSTRGWLTVSVFGFGLASFLSDLGHEAATAALPALLLTIGTAPAALGLIEGIADGLSSFSKLLGGWIADQPKRRKPIAVVGYLVTGLAQGVFAFATAWTHVLFARSAAWIARGLRSPAREAMLADSVPPEARGRAFGLHRAMDTSGAALGPVVATLLLSIVPLRHVFGWAIVPGVLAALAFAVLVRPDRTTRTLDPQPFWKSVSALPPRFRGFLGAVFLFGMGDFARTLLLLRATQLMVPEWGIEKAATTAMLLYAGHNVIYAAASYPVGWLADRMSPERLLVVGYAVGVATAVMAAFAVPSLGYLIALFAVGGLTLAFEDTLEGTVTAHQIPSHLRGTGYGVLATTNGVGDLLSSSIVGGLWSLAGPEVAFSFAALLALAGTLVLARTATDRPTPKSP